MNIKNVKGTIAGVHRSYFIKALAIIANNEDGYVRRNFIEELLWQLSSGTLEQTGHEFFGLSQIIETAQTLKEHDEAEASRDE